MSRDATTIVDEAIAWRLREPTMPAGDWPTFVAWLEGDPAHAHAYDAVARQDRLIDQTVFPVTARAANDDAPVARRWLWAAGATGIAAALALWVSPILTARGGEQVYATRDGEHRTVTLADGTQIALNGGTRLSIEPGGRAARLDRGEAMLHVTHDAAQPFVLRAGDQVIQDVGTSFDVVRTAERIAVAVAEGEVALQRPDGAIRLQRGEAVTVDARSGAMQRAAVAPDAVGGWRAGMLSFNAVPLAVVAAALRRQEGLGLTLTGDLSRRPFTGMVRLTGTADRDIPHLADLIGATWRRDGDQWVLAERSTTVR